jgi:hypothetical protein
MELVGSLVFTQLVKKFPAVIEAEGYYRVQKPPLLERNLADLSRPSLLFYLISISNYPPICAYVFQMVSSLDVFG